MSKIEPETWKHRTDWQQPEGRHEWDDVVKEGTGLVKGHVWMTHGHGEQCRDWLGLSLGY